LSQGAKEPAQAAEKKEAQENFAAVSDQELKYRLIKYLTEQGGQCALKKLAKYFGLKNNLELRDRIVVQLRGIASSADPKVLVLSEKFTAVKETANAKSVPEKPSLNSVEPLTDNGFREDVVVRFGEWLQKVEFSIDEASEYLAKKQGMREIEGTEILRRFKSGTKC
jgi:hypothetical protein